MDNAAIPAVPVIQPPSHALPVSAGSISSKAPAQPPVHKAHTPPTEYAFAQTDLSSMDSVSIHVVQDTSQSMEYVSPAIPYAHNVQALPIPALHVSQDTPSITLPTHV